MFDLGVTGTISEWPVGVSRLSILVSSSEPAGSYEFPSFEIPRAAGNSFTCIGRAIVHDAKTVLSRPLEFYYQASMDGEPNFEIVVTGYRALHFDVIDPGNPVTGSTLVDNRIRQLRERLRTVGALDDQEKEDFLRILGAIGAIANLNLTDPTTFVKVTSEDEFQERLRHLLRNRPEIGSDLEEHPRASSGITDLSYRKIRIENKHEDSVPVSISTAAEFLPQLQQYVVGSDRRFGILCILDSTPKAHPPENTVFDDIEIKVQDTNAEKAILPIMYGIVVIRAGFPVPSRLKRSTKRRRRPKTKSRRVRKGSQRG